MARLPRLDMPGVPQHVIQRGNNRTACFFDPADYTFYLECLGEAAQKARCAVHAYVLMTNHVHLLVTAEVPGGLSLMMQSLGRRYVRYVNRLYGRTGTLWEGRFKSSLVESERYFLTCSRYIELNPVRAARWCGNPPIIPGRVTGPMPMAKGRRGSSIMPVICTWEPMPRIGKQRIVRFSKTRSIPRA